MTSQNRTLQGENRRFKQKSKGKDYQNMIGDTLQVQNKSV